MFLQVGTTQFLIFSLFIKAVEKPEARSLKLEVLQILEQKREAGGGS